MYPPLFKIIESEHDNTGADFIKMARSQGSKLQKRKEYIQKTLSSFMSNPDFYMTADEMINELRDMTYGEDLLETYQKYIRAMMDQ